MVSARARLSNFICLRPSASPSRTKCLPASPVRSGAARLRFCCSARPRVSLLARLWLSPSPSYIKKKKKKKKKNKSRGQRESQTSKLGDRQAQAMKDRRKRYEQQGQIDLDWRAGKGQNTSRYYITYAKASPNYPSLAKTRQKNRLTDVPDVWHALYMATNRLGIRQYRLMVNLTTDQELILTRLSARATNERGRMVSRSEVIRELIDKASSVLGQPLQTTTVQPMQFGEDDPSNPLG